MGPFIHQYRLRFRLLFFLLNDFFNHRLILIVAISLRRGRRCLFLRLFNWNLFLFLAVDVDWERRGERRVLVPTKPTIEQVRVEVSKIVTHTRVMMFLFSRYSSASGFKTSVISVPRSIVFPRGSGYTVKSLSSDDDAKTYWAGSGLFSDFGATDAT